MSKRKNINRNVVPLQTNSDIPRVSYRLALSLIGLIFIMLWIFPAILLQFNISPIWPTAIFGGTMTGFYISYIFMVKLKKTEINKKFWIFGSFISLLIACMVLLMYGSGILL